MFVSFSDLSEYCDSITLFIIPYIRFFARISFMRKLLRLWEIYSCAEIRLENIQISPVQIDPVLSCNVARGVIIG